MNKLFIILVIIVTLSAVGWNLPKDMTLEYQVSGTTITFHNVVSVERIRDVTLADGCRITADQVTLEDTSLIVGWQRCLNSKLDNLTTYDTYILEK